MPGTYVLILTLDHDQPITVGALGTITFTQGTYAYVGSANGPGGFTRIKRHQRIATGDHDTQHWHIDYLLPHATITDIYTTEEAIECKTAQALHGTPIPDFGSSDCTCTSHLIKTPTPQLTRLGYTPY
jgi:Uri superfamily endonuclease